ALRAYLTRRRQILVETLHRDAGDLVEILPQGVGMHVMVRLAPEVARRIGDAALLERASAQGLVLAPLSGQYARGTGEQGFLLGYAGWTEAEMSDAVARLVGLLRSAQHG